MASASKKQTYSLISVELDDAPTTQSVREIVVPSDLDLDCFRMVLNYLYGWNAGHPSSFFLDTDDECIEVSDDYWNDECDYDFYEIKLDKAFKMSGGTFRYMYDLCDEHEHVIKLIKKGYKPETGRYPVYCIKAEGPKGFEESYSEDDELMCEANGVQMEDLLDEKDFPVKKYWEMRAVFTTPMDRINEDLATVCKHHRLRKIGEPAPKTAK